MARFSVFAVARVLVSDHSGWPVIAASEITHSTGAAATASASSARSRGVRAGHR